MKLRSDQLHRANLNHYLFGESQLDTSDMFIAKFSVDDSNKLKANVTAWTIDRHGNVDFKNLNILTSSFDFDKNCSHGITNINHKAHITIDRDEYDDEVRFTIGSRVNSSFNIYNNYTRTVKETTISRHPITFDFSANSINDVIIMINFPYTTSAPIIRIYKDIDFNIVEYKKDDYIIDGKDKDKLVSFNDDSNVCIFNSTLVEHHIKTQEIKIISDMNIKSMSLDQKIDYLNHYLSSTDINYDFAVGPETRYTISSKSVNGLNTKSEVGPDKYTTHLFYKDELIEGVDSDDASFSTVFGMTVNKNDASESYYIDGCTVLDNEDNSAVDAKNIILPFLEEYFDVEESEYQFKFYVDNDGRVFVTADYSSDDANIIVTINCRLVKDKYLYIYHKIMARDAQSIESSYILIDLEDSAEIFTEYHHNVGGTDNCKYNDSNGYIYTSTRSFRMEDEKPIVNQKYNSPELSFDIDFNMDGNVIKINTFNSLIYNYNDHYVVIRDSYGIPNLLFINI